MKTHAKRKKSFIILRNTKALRYKHTTLQGEKMLNAFALLRSDAPIVSIQIWIFPESYILKVTFNFPLRSLALSSQLLRVGAAIQGRCRLRVSCNALRHRSQSQTHRESRTRRGFDTFHGYPLIKTSSNQNHCLKRTTFAPC